MPFARHEHSRIHDDQNFRAGQPFEGKLIGRGSYLEAICCNQLGKCFIEVVVSVRFIQENQRAIFLESRFFQTRGKVIVIIDVHLDYLLFPLDDRLPCDSENRAQNNKEAQTTFSYRHELVSLFMVCRGNQRFQIEKYLPPLVCIF
jgi:hypothetical protein